MTEVRTWHGAWRPFALAFATVGVVALLALAGVRWVVWPNLDWFRPAIEAWLRATVGVPIALEGVQGEWHAWASPQWRIARWQMRDDAGDKPFLWGSAEGRWSWQEGWRIAFTAQGVGLEKLSGTLHLFDRQWRVQWHAVGVTGRAWQPFLATWTKSRAGETGHAPEAFVLPNFVELAGTVRGAERTITQVALQFSELSLPATPEFPGVSGISGALRGSRAEGVFSVRAAKSVWRWPEGWFAETEQTFTDVVWQGRWHYDSATGYTVQTEHFHAVTPEGRVTASGVLDALERPAARRVAMHAVIEAVDLERFARYFPPAAVGQTTVDWLGRAFVQGKIPAAHLAIEGPLAAFPFRHGRGVFLVEIPVQGVTLQFDSRWPAVTIERAMVRFRNEALHIEVHDARAEKLRFAPVVATIPDLGADAPVLMVQGTVEGRWSNVLRYLVQSPLANDLPLAQLLSWQAQGDAHLDLALTIPLSEGAVGVAGTLTLDRFSVPAAVAAWPLTKGKATIRFDANGVRSAEGTGVWGEIPIQLTWPDGARSEVAVTAMLSGKTLAQQLGLPSAALQGTTPVRAHVTWTPEGVIRWHATSDVDGLALALPAPLTKTASERWSLQAEGEVTKNGWQASVALGDRLRWQRTQTGAWALAIGQVALPPATPNGAIAVALERLDLDAWDALLDEMGQAQQAVWPSLTLSVDQLTAMQREWHQVRFTGRAHATQWNFQVRAAEVIGSGTVTQRGDRIDRFEAEFDRLWVAPQQKRSQNDSRASSGNATHDSNRIAALDPSRWPTARVTVADLRVADAPLGRFALVAAQDGATWRVQDALLVQPGRYRLRGRGSWESHATGGGRSTRSTWHIEAQIGDFGATLATLWQLPGIEKGQGTIDATLSWPGSPLDFTWRTLEGTGSIALEKGVFSEIEPGAGKLLTVFSLPMLFRRLQLDFRDLTQKGLAYDRLMGSFAVANGYLTTSDLTIDAPVALTQLAGSIDLDAEAQELEIRVVPRLGNTAATAIAFVNPVAGLLTFLGQQILGDPLGQILVQRYRVSGSWRAPQVTALRDNPPNER